MDDYSNRIENLIAQGENRGIEFKTADVRPEGLAREITALVILTVARFLSE